MDETDALRADEYVLRRVPLATTPAQPPFTQAAFRATPRDNDGLSLFRERFTTAYEVAEKVGRPFECHVVRLRVEFILEIEECGIRLSLKPDPAAPPIPRGHCLVPEISTIQKAKNKAAYRELSRALADLANDENRSKIAFAPRS